MVGMPLVMASSKGMPKSLDASYVEHILVGQLVFLLYLFLFAGLNVLGKDRVAALVHHVYLFLWGVIVVHDFLLGIFAYGYHAVGALAGTSKLIVVYLGLSSDNTVGCG